MSNGAMRGCECGEHVWLVLHEREGGLHVGLRVHTQLGQWFDSEQAGVTRLIEGVTTILRGAGREPRAVIVSHDAERRGPTCSWGRRGRRDRRRVRAGRRPAPR